jgi:hypothetical protein
MNADTLLLTLSTLVLVLSPSSAWAYLDPGTGSYFLQLLLGGVLAGLFALKMFWARVKTWFRNLRGPSRATPPEGRGSADDR